MAIRNLPKGQVYQRDAKFRFTIYGRLFARDLAPFHAYMSNGFHKEYGVPITLGGATLFKRYVRKQMRPPRYPKDPRTNKSVWAEPSTPSGGFAWYSGTLRRALHARIGKVQKHRVTAAMLPDHKKGWPPHWVRWGKRKNAYKYARWIEFGQVPGQPARPIMRMGFNKGKRTVANWMIKRTGEDFMKAAKRYRKHRVYRPGGVR